ncbi:MAG: hypothetical protein R3B90_03870 [Planctomycetaceae bacterium]
MKYVALTVALLTAAPAFAEDKAACLEVGSRVGAFYVSDVTGPAAGEKLCYRCRFGDKPVVSIFAREVNDELAALVKEVDAQVAANKDAGMAAFVVLLTENPEADSAKLKALAEKQGIQHTPLTTFDGVAGPDSYKIAQDSDVTVMMWVDGKLKVNEAFPKSELTAAKVPAVVGKTSEILN